MIEFKNAYNKVINDKKQIDMIVNLAMLEVSHWCKTVHYDSSKIW